MCTNNAIISNNQSKDLIALRCLNDIRKPLDPSLQAILIILIIFKKYGYFIIIIHILHSTNDELTYLGMLLAAVYLQQMQNMATDLLEGYLAQWMLVYCD